MRHHVNLKYVTETLSSYNIQSKIISKTLRKYHITSNKTDLIYSMTLQKYLLYTYVKKKLM